MVLLFTLVSIPVRDARGEDKFEPPGAKEQAEVDKANQVLDGVYRDLMAKAEEPEEKTSLRDAQRPWIKWRDAEAMSIARHGDQSEAVRSHRLRGRSVEVDQ